MKPLLEQAPAVRTATASLPKTAAASVQIVDPLAVADWDALVMRLPGHSFFHSSAWARTLEESYGYKPMYFAKVENGELRALLPMMEVNSWLTGKRGVSLPFSDICEPLVGRVAPRAPSEGSELFQAAIEHGRSRRWKYVETRSAGNGAGNLSPSESFHGHTLELSRDEEKIFFGFESSVRRAIRKAEKEGVKVEISRSPEGIKEFYSLHCLTRQKHGVPPQPFSFFANFHRHIIAHNVGMVVIARLNGQPIAASVFVHFGSKAIYKYGASDEKFQSLRGANTVMWHAIQWYARAGFEQLDFGRTDIGHEGLRRFKLGWGAVESSINYFKYDLRAQRFTDGKGESSLIREQVFKHVPIPIARMIGSVLYRHVA
jgi:CelD/BcsL family acetyltransferase involved in cellulose biosynthesis